MKAARIHRYGGPDVLVYEDAPEPVARAGELLVGVEAVGVNPADYKFRNGSLAHLFPKPMPLILGMDVAGVVRALGSGVRGFSVGDPVVAMIPYTHKGGYAEQVAAPASFFAIRPQNLAPELAAALPTPGVTGAELVEEDLAVRPGMRVLVSGATGGVGRAACYAAQALGAHVTAAVRARHRDAVQCADEVLVLDEPDAGSRTAWDEFDVIADTVGGAVANGLLRRLRRGGVLSSVSTTPVGDVGGLDVVSRRFACHPDAARLRRLAQAVADGALKPQLPQTLPLQQAADAHRRIEAGDSGKIVLLPGVPTR